MVASVPFRGANTALIDEGPPQAPVVVLLHGFTGSQACWDPLAAALTPTHRVLRPDLPGHGRTTVRDVTFDDLPRWLDGLLEARDVGRATFVGYSLGGRLALAFALARPERLDGLLLESASAGLADRAARERRRAEDEQRARHLEEAGIAAFVERWEALGLFDSQRTLPPAVRNRQREQRLTNAAEGLAASLRHLGLGAQPWLGDRLDEIHVPTRVVAGVLDTKFAAIAPTLAGSIRGSTLTLVPGSGHAVHLERPEAFEREVRALLDDVAHLGQGAPS